MTYITPDGKYHDEDPVIKRIRKAVEQERKACAAIARDAWHHYLAMCNQKEHAENIARCIEARGE